MTKSSVWFDLDETLVGHLYDEGELRYLVDEGKYKSSEFTQVCWTDSQGKNRSCWYVLRPGARELLDTLLKKGYVLNILTSGSTEYQKHVLKALKLDHYFVGVYGRDTYEQRQCHNQIKFPIPKGRFVLVDDLDASRFPGSRNKIGALLGITNYESGIAGEQNPEHEALVDQAIPTSFVLASGWCLRTGQSPSYRYLPELVAEIEQKNS